MKKCRYCRLDLTVARGPTKDHVVPAVVMRIGPRIGFHLSVHGNRVHCCRNCNKAKGSMPVTDFLANRFDPGRLKARRHYWEKVHADVAIVLKTDPGFYDHPLCELIRAEFSKPVPPHFVTGTRPIEVKYAADRLVDFVRGQ